MEAQGCRIFRSCIAASAGIGGANEGFPQLPGDSAADGLHRRLRGRGMGETMRAVTVNGEDMLWYSGYLLRKKGG